MSNPEATVAILGGGRRGLEWATYLVSKNYMVKIQDPSGDSASKVQNMIREMERAKPKSILRGIPSKRQTSLVSATKNLKEALTGSKFIIECIPENLELKQKCISDVAVALGELKNNDVIMGLATTNFKLTDLISTSGNETFKKNNVMLFVGTQPVYFNQVVEIVPTPETSKANIQKMKEFVYTMGKRPIVHTNCTMGPASARFSAAILYQAWQYFKDGALTIPNIELMTKEGFGPYYMYSGPFEICQLEGKGLPEYCSKHSKRIQEVNDKPGNYPFPADADEVKNTGELTKFLLQPSQLERVQQERDGKLNVFIPVPKK